MADAAGWSDLERANPELAATGARLLYQDKPLATAYLATVAPDSGPRVHPVFPALALGDLWLFIVDMSPKYRDLMRNRWFALHTLPTPEGGEEFYVRGHAEPVGEPVQQARVTEATGQGGMEFEALFRCTLVSVLYTRWDNWGTAEAWPSYQKWRAD